MKFASTHTTGEPTLLSVASGAIFPFLDTVEATDLRETCSEARDAVADFPWHDVVTRIDGSLYSWRACFPKATAANIECRLDLEDDDFIHLRGVCSLNMARCTQPRITNAAFAHLRGIRTLNMLQCFQTTITDAAFAHLRDIHTLDMSGCDQLTITNAISKHLVGIHTLNICYCRQLSSALFESLGIKKLWAFGCSNLLPASP